MAFRKAFNAADGSRFNIDFPNAYFRIQNININRMLQGEAPNDDPDFVDERTSWYMLKVQVSVFADTPDIQGKDIDYLSFECPLDEVWLEDGDNIIAKTYNYLAHADFSDAESV